MPDPLKPLPPDRFDYWKAQHLLNRAGFGGTPSQVRTLANMGLRGAVDYIVDYEDIPYEAVEVDSFDRDIMRPPTEQERNKSRQARQSGDEVTLDQLRRERQRRQGADRQQMRKVQEWWIERMIETPRPLEEKMTLFWHGHFATNYRAIEDSYHMFVQNQMFRANAVKSFNTLAHGIIEDPAMLRYLNNNQNVRRQPNENLARELMELFTLGEGNDYTETDIKEGARALTGYTYNDDTFTFRQRVHDSGMKRILGKSGQWNGHDFVDIILTRNAASQFICWKLYRFFVNDLPGDPSPQREDYILRLAQLLRRREYSIKAVLKTIFLSEHFYDTSNQAALIKSPIQLIVQCIRSLRTPVHSLEALQSASDLMGQDLFYPPSVKGWDVGRPWINTATMFVRHNFMIYALTGRRPDAYPWQTDGTSYDAMHLVEHLRGPQEQLDTQDVATYLLRFMLGAEPREERVTTLVQFVDDRGGQINNQIVIALLCLIAAMPEYQLC